MRMALAPALAELVSVSGGVGAQAVTPAAVAQLLAPKLAVGPGAGAGAERRPLDPQHGCSRVISLN